MAAMNARVEGPMAPNLRGPENLFDLHGRKAKTFSKCSAAARNAREQLSRGDKDKRWGLRPAAKLTRLYFRFCPGKS
jgi:hypothetical protein